MGGGGGLVPSGSGGAGLAMRGIDDKLIDDHLAVQAIIRSYQVKQMIPNFQNLSL